MTRGQAAKRGPFTRKSDKRLEQEYVRFFRPLPAPAPVNDDDQSLEQPSFLKVVPSVTTYGVAEPATVR